ncbi:MAG: HAD-IA family hydrolase [Clostridia bacterium]|nr:HAD-IA family hydrolase [Clostridia bacterium]
MKKKLLIFDLDGTIADTIYSIRDGVNMAMDKYGMPRKSYEDIRVAIGNGARLLVKRCMPEDRRNDDALAEAVFADYDRFYGQTFANIDGCYEGMSEAMHALHARGYRLAVLSNKQDAYVKKIIGLLFADGIISLAAGQTELPTKPDPTVPLMIAESLGVSAEDCAFIGDSEVDVLTAKNAGMTAVACSWGYRPREALAGADVVLERPSQLVGIFE